MNCLHRHTIRITIFLMIVICIFPSIGYGARKVRFQGKPISGVNKFKAGIPPIQANLSLSKIDLDPDGNRQKYESSINVELKVGSIAPEWKVFCIVEPVGNSGTNSHKEDAVSILVGGRKITLSENTPTLLVEGKETGPHMITAASMKFSIQIDPFKPADTYRCRIHFLLKAEGVSGLITGPNIVLAYNHQQFVCIEMDKRGLSFGKNLSIGDNQAGPAVILVITNMENLNLVFSLDELNLVDSDLPRGKIKSNMITLGCGLTAQDAMRTMRENRKNHFGIRCPTGRHNIYLYSKVKIDIGHRPGDYEGVIKVQF